MSKQTKSEQLFEEFCNSIKIKYKRIDAAKEQRPDYLLEVLGQKIAVEVKQINPNEEEKEIIELNKKEDYSAFSIEPGKRLGKAIRYANPQFKKLLEALGEEIPCLLVVYDNVTPEKHHTIPYCVQTAISGLDKVELSVPTNPQESILIGEPVSGLNQTMRQDNCTTTSAVAVLHCSQHPNFSLVIYHNPFAANPLNPDLLRFVEITQYRKPKSARNSLANWDNI